MQEPSTDSKKRVLVVDDHAIVRRGVIELIEQEPDLAVVGEASGGSAALKLLESEKPHIAIVDISLRDVSGIELIKDMKIHCKNIKILVLSMHDETFYAERVLHAGAQGYMTKSESADKLVEAIREILAGRVYVSSQVATKMISRLAGVSEPSASSIDSLSDRQFEVFELIGQGFQTREIAQKLHMSVKTVDTHRENIKRKLSLTNAAQLQCYAIQWVQQEQNS